MSNQLTTFDSIYVDGFVELSLIYARLYKQQPRAFISCFIKSNAIKNCCLEIVRVYKSKGVYKECEATGKSFKEYAERKVSSDWVETFASILLILYSIIHQTNANE